MLSVSCSAHGSVSLSLALRPAYNSRGAGGRSLPRQLAFAVAASGSCVALAARCVRPPVPIIESPAAPPGSPTAFPKLLEWVCALPGETRCVSLTAPRRPQGRTSNVERGDARPRARTAELGVVGARRRPLGPAAASPFAARGRRRGGGGPLAALARAGTRAAAHRRAARAPPAPPVPPDVVARLMAAVSFGYGVFQLCASLLPPSLLRLISFLGFEGDRQLGLAALMFARQGRDMRAPLASILELFAVKDSGEKQLAEQQPVEGGRSERQTRAEATRRGADGPVISPRQQRRRVGNPYSAARAPPRRSAPAGNPHRAGREEKGNQALPLARPAGRPADAALAPRAKRDAGSTREAKRRGGAARRGAAWLASARLSTAGGAAKRGFMRITTALTIMGR
ncbi:tetratricopeptide repeat protein 39C-like [Gryllus bimaculatus]|nr:tetratricopeptide repeat protein 39C-like [Gryllus bimaculatus]